MINESRDYLNNFRMFHSVSAKLFRLQVHTNLPVGHFHASQVGSTKFTSLENCRVSILHLIPKPASSPQLQSETVV